ncbi:MAG: 4Fe-4S dicluster domain-containing protein [Elusimicrobia bacterium]|nr:4Fe-4S dicluster domain-containing protein [Elusimicrobiota bacterium]
MAHRIRRLTQTAFLLLGLCVFSGVPGDRKVAAFYHAFHVFPSLASLTWFMLPPWGLASLAVAGAVLLAALLFGRLYCGWLCPAGFLQELAAGLGRRLGLEGRTAGGWTMARLFVLVLCLGFLAHRSSTYMVFDHFSALGRVFGLPHALLAGGPFGANFGLGLAFLAVLFIVPLRWPRWFCGALCPSGTLFMLLRALAPGKVRRGLCGTDCGRCAEVCPALCVSRGGIDAKLCVDCLECTSICADGALAYSFHKPWRVLPPQNECGVPTLRRRELLASAGLSVAGWSGASWLRSGLLRIGPAAAVVPPGGKAHASFFERCVGCDTCVSVCPSRVLVPAGRELDLGALTKVRLDYKVSYCAYECNACLAVCPTGAISYFPLAAKKRIRIGKSRLIKKLCIPFEFGRDCGACQEQCPTGALTMEPHKSVYVPVQHEEYCIGCGACQFACPTRPRKAIVVDPVEVHAFASPPKRGSKIDCRACAAGKGGQACWRCRPDPSEESGGFPF